MTTAHRDPHVLVSARISRHPKIVHLPTDAARWAWIVVLGEAKLQRPPGEFASRRVLDACLGDLRRWVPSIIAAGLLEEADGRVIVHDWVAHQDRRAVADRVAMYRSRNADVTQLYGPGNGFVAAPTRAGARPLQSQSYTVTETTGEGGPGGGFGDPLVRAWETATGRTMLASSAWTWDLLGDLVGRRGESEVVEAIGSIMADPPAEFGRVPSGVQLATALRNRLDPLPSAKDDAAALATERESIRARRAREATMRTIHDSGRHTVEPDERCPACQP